MKLSDFDYQLPPGLIAQKPAEPRDGSRLMVLHRDSGAVEHAVFRDIARYLRPDDLLVVNNTKVMPARLLGRKSGSGGEVEILLLRRVEGGTWSCLVRPGRRLRPGAEVEIGDGKLRARILQYQDRGRRLVEFRHDGDFFAVLEEVGHVPLPPYIARGDAPADRQRYQTVYAREAGAVAAPTAGLHFTPELLAQVKSKGVEVLDVLLHVGWGTFKSVEADDVRQHRMDAEYYRIPDQTAAALKVAQAGGRRIVAVGTTTTRALESFAASGKTEDWTEIFIYPPYRFQLVGALVTNFHLPKSTLLMLVSAIAGAENIRKAYAEAIRERYRFYSYGDAMLII
ncbi:MAG TPA: tRNA preQ1(34) S-adenosylmethionine ribosyltransferase-isomerase QueA [Candidatus Edwardsbacteria bacterium]|nr:tRNA preQ1(34) S-adenosylmethionine ribosyltransferase-isomerase QueA [Candidatus Edwardsbacteria bacterium]